MEGSDWWVVSVPHGHSGTQAGRGSSSRMSVVVKKREREREMERWNWSSSMLPSRSVTLRIHPLTTGQKWSQSLNQL